MTRGRKREPERVDGEAIRKDGTKMEDGEEGRKKRKNDGEQV